VAAAPFAHIEKTDAILAITPSHRLISAISAITYPSRRHHMPSHLAGASFNEPQEQI
jgi:hypothetical protein